MSWFIESFACNDWGNGMILTQRLLPLFPLECMAWVSCCLHRPGREELPFLSLICPNNNHFPVYRYRNTSYNQSLPQKCRFRSSSCAKKKTRFIASCVSTMYVFEHSMKAWVVTYSGESSAKHSAQVGSLLHAPSWIKHLSSMQLYRSLKLL